jgi:hypothetical protein
MQAHRSNQKVAHLSLLQQQGFASDFMETVKKIRKKLGLTEVENKK